MVMHFQICPCSKNKASWIRMVILLVGLELVGFGGYGEKRKMEFGGL